MLSSATRGQQPEPFRVKETRDQDLVLLDLELGNPGAQAPTAATNYGLAASQLLLMNLLCFVSLAKYLLEQGQEAVPILLSYFISSGAFGMGEQLGPEELLDQTLSKALSQAEEFATQTLGKTWNTFT